MNDQSTIGRYYETLFKAECLRRGLIVLQPECSHLPFDVAIFSNEKFLRIQVKGTKSLGPDGYRIPLIGHNGQSYVQSGVDFVAAYVEPTKTWYIIPAILATGRNMKIARTPTAEGRAALTKERWDYLGATA